MCPHVWWIKWETCTNADADIFKDITTTGPVVDGGIPCIGRIHLTAECTGL